MQSMEYTYRLILYGPSTYQKEILPVQDIIEVEELEVNISETKTLASTLQVVRPKNDGTLSVVF